MSSENNNLEFPNDASSFDDSYESDSSVEHVVLPAPREIFNALDQHISRRHELCTATSRGQVDDLEDEMALCRDELLRMLTEYGSDAQGLVSEWIATRGDACPGWLREATEQSGWPYGIAQMQLDARAESNARWTILAPTAQAAPGEHGVANQCRFGPHSLQPTPSFAMRGVAEELRQMHYRVHPSGSRLEWSQHDIQDLGVKLAEAKTSFDTLQEERKIFDTNDRYNSWYTRAKRDFDVCSETLDCIRYASRNKFGHMNPIPDPELVGFQPIRGPQKKSLAELLDGLSQLSSKVQLAQTNKDLDAIEYCAGVYAVRIKDRLAKLASEAAEIEATVWLDTLSNAGAMREQLDKGGPIAALRAVRSSLANGIETRRLSISQVQNELSGEMADFLLRTTIYDERTEMLQQFQEAFSAQESIYDLQYVERVMRDALNASDTDITRTRTYLESENSKMDLTSWEGLIIPGREASEKVKNDTEALLQWRKDEVFLMERKRHMGDKWDGATTMEEFRAIVGRHLSSVRAGSD